MQPPFFFFFSFTAGGSTGSADEVSSTLFDDVNLSVPSSSFAGSCSPDQDEFLPPADFSTVDSMGLAVVSAVISAVVTAVVVAVDGDVVSTTDPNDESFPTLAHLADDSERWQMRAG